MMDADWIAQLESWPEGNPLPAWIPAVDELEALRLRAQQLGDQGDMEGALRLLERGAILAASGPDLAAPGVIWRGRANVLQRHERYTESLAASDAAVEIYQRCGSEFDMARARTVQIYVLGALERFDEAIALAAWVRERFAVVDSDLARLGLASVAANLGQIYVDAWQLEAAMAELEKAYHLYQELGMASRAAWTLQDMGLTAARMDRLELAEDYYRRAYAALTASGDVFRFKIRFNQAEVALRRGAYEAALNYLQQAREELQSLPEAAENEAFVDRFEAQTRQALGQPNEAGRLLRQALAIFQGFNRRLETARTLRELGALPARTESAVAQSLAYLEAALGILQTLEMPLLTAGVQLEAAALLLGLKRTGEAADLAEAAQRIFSAAGLRLRAAQADLLLAHSRQRRQPEVAAFRYRQALMEAGEEVPMLTAECWRGLGRLSAQTGEMAAAEAAYERAFGALEQVRGALRGQYHQAGFFEGQQALIEEIFALLTAQPGREYALLGWLERFKGRVLADLLAHQLPDLGSSAQLADLVAERTALRRLLDQRWSALLGGERNLQTEIPQRGPAWSAYESYQTQELAAVRGRLMQIEEAIQRQRDGAECWREGLTFDPATVHEGLDAETLLVSYYPADGKLWALTATQTPGDLEVQPLATTLAEIEERLLQISRWLLPPLRQEAVLRQRLAALWEILLAPLAERLEQRSRLLILPYRTLAQVPFAALYDGQTGRYLIERWQVQLAPGLTVRQLCRALPAAVKPPLLVGWSGGADQPGYLPAVAQEIAALQAAFPAAAVLLGEAASPEAVLAQAGGRRTVHLASHAVYDNQAPLESGIQLAGGQWLRAQDLYLHYGVLQGALVVLSACSAARGRALGGDLLGLTGALLYAGARGVISGLWRVDDAATSALMQQFYAALKAGAEPAAALQQAQRAFLTEGPYRHPYYWAAFGLTGEG